MNFFRDLQAKNSAIQIGFKDRVIEIVNPESDIETAVTKVAELFRDSDLYFVGGINPAKGKVRAEDSDVVEKKYFYVDFDVRKAHPEMSNDDIKALWKWFSALLEGTQFGSWRYAVFTGNGLHVYYVSEEAVPLPNPDHWREGLRKVAKDMLEITSERADESCINAARIGRLPGSFNQKSSPATAVEIIDSQDRWATFFPEILENGRLMIEDRKRYAEEQARIISEKYSGDDEFQKINSLPVAKIVSAIMGWEIHTMKNGKTVFREPGKSNNSACFVPSGENFVVHGGTGHYPDPGVRGQRPFDFVKHVKQFSNRETFFWFKDHYPEIFVEGEAKKAEPIAPVKSPGGNIMSVFESMRTLDFTPLAGVTPLGDKVHFIPTTVTRVGAMSYTGKSKFCYYLSHCFLKAGLAGQIFSTEVRAERVLAEMLHIIHPQSQSALDILWRKINISPDMVETYRNLEIYDVTNFDNSLEKIRDILRSSNKHREENGLPRISFIIIDFVQMIQPIARAGNEFHAAALYAKEIQQIAQENKICVIDVSQLNSSGFEDKGADHGHIPFRNSLALYDNADVAMVLRRDRSSYGAQANVMRVSVRKNKYGHPAEVDVEYNHKDGSFTAIPVKRPGGDLDEEE